MSDAFTFISHVDRDGIAHRPGGRKLQKQVNPCSVAVCAYIAGLVDGEGYIGIKSRGRANHPAPCIQITQKDPAVLYSVMADLGVGHIYEPKGYAFKFEVTGARTVFAVLALIRPYLRVKHDKADEVLRYVPPPTGRPRRGSGPPAAQPSSAQLRALTAADF